MVWWGRQPSTLLRVTAKMRVVTGGLPFLLRALSSDLPPGDCLFLTLGAPIAATVGLPFHGVLSSRKFDSRGFAFLDGNHRCDPSFAIRRFCPWHVGFLVPGWVLGPAADVSSMSCPPPAVASLLLPAVVYGGLRGPSTAGRFRSCIALWRLSAGLLVFGVTL
jgi:hypothetical protein